MSYNNINPFEILGISEDFECDNYLNKFYSHQQKALLSCYILDNQDKFIRIGNTFKIKNNEDPFYYTIINDINNLKKLYSENKYIILQKENKGRNLLHYAAIGNYYDISLFLLEKGINVNDPDNGCEGALPRTPISYTYNNDDLKNLLEKFGGKNTLYNVGNISQEFNSKGINITFKKDANLIDEIYKQFLKRGILNKISQISLIINNRNEIIGKRLLRTKKCEKDTSTWINVYHGTRLASLEHILILGLRNFGKPLNEHIPLGEKVFDINDWGNAIFASPSIFYASKYSDIILSENEEWYIIIEAKVSPNSFSIHESTIYNYQFKKGEPKNLEYRIEADQNMYGRYMTGDEDFIETNSILFVKKSFLNNCKDYSEIMVINKL